MQGKVNVLTDYVADVLENTNCRSRGADRPLPIVRKDMRLMVAHYRDNWTTAADRDSRLTLYGRQASQALPKTLSRALR